MQCQCGKVYNLSSGSSNAERMLVLEKQFHLATDMINQPNYNAELFYDTFYEEEIDVVLCDQCGRIHLYNGDGKYITYIRLPS